MAERAVTGQDSGGKRARGGAPDDPSAKRMRRSGSASSSGSGAGGRKKKMVIRPFRVAPRPPEAFVGDTFKQLEEAVAAVHAKRPASRSREELYRAVESLCIHKKAEEVYERLEAQCDAHVRRVVAGLTHQTADPEAFLALVDSAWRDHREQMMTVRSVFLYLDRTYVVGAARGVRSLWELGLELFRRHLTASPEVRGKAVRAVLDLVRRERGGEHVPRALLRDISRMFVALRIYADTLERDFLAATADFYVAEGEQLAKSLSVADYLVHCQRRVVEENARVGHYLDESTRTPLVATVEEPLIRRHAAALLGGGGFDALLDGGQLEHLSRMYLLLSRVGELAAVRAALRAYAVRAGTELMKPGERDRTLVESLLELKARLDRVVSQSFAGSPDFASTVKDAFEEFVNARTARPEPAELVARHVHGLLRGGAGARMTSDELERRLESVMVLFRIIHGKDVFEAFYKKHLATRLLLGRSASRDAELSMITKLKTECGNSFTKKLEAMFSDMDRSNETNAEFAQHLAGLQKASPSSSSSSADRDDADMGVPAAGAAAAGAAAAPRSAPGGGPDLHVHVLTTGSWPEYAGPTLQLPPAVGARLDQFREFYLAKHTSRKLTWEHSLSTCVLSASFPRRRHELSVSAQQAAVLLLFNDADTLPFADIVRGTGMEDATVARTLQSLIQGAAPVLLHRGRGDRRIRPADSFSYNAAFENKMFRVRINQVQAKETKQEQKETQERVLVDRNFAVDATIVRVMKARKTLSHQALMSETIEQLKFASDPRTIKQRIAGLIERDYLERDKGNSSVYNYLA